MKLDEKFLESYLNSNAPTVFEYELGGQKVWMDYISKYVDKVILEDMILTWMQTTFDGGRHFTRLNKVLK